MKLPRPSLSLWLGSVILTASSGSSSNCLAFTPASTGRLGRRAVLQNSSQQHGASTAVTSLTSLTLLGHNNEGEIRPISSLAMSTVDEASSTNISSFSPSESSLEKLNFVKNSLKRPRGASIGLEYDNTASDISLSDGDFSILSMQLRKSKAAAIWTKDANALTKFSKEQKSAMGDFPGPVPVIYWGSLEESEIAKVVDGEASAIVIDCEQELSESMMSMLKNVGVVWKVSSVDQMQQLIEGSKGDVFLLADSFLESIDENEPNATKESLAALPKSAVTIATLSPMQAENAEVATGKQYASMGISSLLIKACCVGDDEDVKYAQFVVEGISKKSSSSFSMTGLTGSINGHFGVSSHSGETKWQRTKAK